MPHHSERNDDTKTMDNINFTKDDGKELEHRLVKDDGVVNNPPGSFVAKKLLFGKIEKQLAATTNVNRTRNLQMKLLQSRQVDKRSGSSSTIKNNCSINNVMSPSKLSTTTTTPTMTAMSATMKTATAKNTPGVTLIDASFKNETPSTVTPKPMIESGNCDGEDVSRSQSLTSSTESSSSSPPQLSSMPFIPFMPYPPYMYPFGPTSTAPTAVATTTTTATPTSAPSSVPISMPFVAAPPMIPMPPPNFIPSTSPLPSSTSLPAVNPFQVNPHHLIHRQPLPQQPLPQQLPVSQEAPVKVNDSKKGTSMVAKVSTTTRKEMAAKKYKTKMAHSSLSSSSTTLAQGKQKRQFDMAQISEIRGLVLQVLKELHSHTKKVNKSSSTKKTNHLPQQTHPSKDCHQQQISPTRQEVMVATSSGKRRSPTSTPTQTSHGPPAEQLHYGQLFGYMSRMYEKLLEERTQMRAEMDLVSKKIANHEKLGKRKGANPVTNNNKGEKVEIMEADDDDDSSTVVNEDKGIGGEQQRKDHCKMSEDEVFKALVEERKTTKKNLLSIEAQLRDMEKQLFRPDQYHVVNKNLQLSKRDFEKKMKKHGILGVLFKAAERVRRRAVNRRNQRLCRNGRKGTMDSTTTTTNSLAVSGKIPHSYTEDQKINCNENDEVEDVGDDVDGASSDGSVVDGSVGGDINNNNSDYVDEIGDGSPSLKMAKQSENVNVF